MKKRIAIQMTVAMSLLIFSWCAFAFFLNVNHLFYAGMVLVVMVVLLGVLSHLSSCMRELSV